MKSSSSNAFTYAIITPARNEEALIEGVIHAVVNQTISPQKWIIVSDGSTDKTEAIVRKYEACYNYIELLILPVRNERNFAAKARAFNVAYKRLAKLQFDAIANLDADITFEPDYIEFLLTQLKIDSELGVVGTPFVENHIHSKNHTYSHKFAHFEHVSGACQMFRRKCFDEIGGYVPVKGGAVDWIAVTTARMKGWKTRTFTEKICYHHRVLGTGNNNRFFVRFHYGKKAYYVGGHPVWELMRGAFQMRQKPVVIGGLLFILGYMCAFLIRMPRVVSQDLIDFHRNEQLSRLRKILYKFVRR